MSIGLSRLSAIKKKEIAVYNSNFDYEKYEITDLKEELVKAEEIIQINKATIKKSTFLIAKELYNVNMKLANFGNGTYMAWCEAVGINKDKSSILLKGYNLYLETNREKAAELSNQMIKTLTSKNNNLSSEEKIIIIEAAEPVKKLEEIQKSYSLEANNLTHINSIQNVVEAEIIEEPLKNGSMVIDKTSLINKKKELKRKMDELTREIHIIADEMFEIDKQLEN